MTIEFRDPPPPGSGAGGISIWQRRLEPLLKHPGRWAMVHTAKDRGAAATAAWMLRNGRLKVPPGRWEFKARMAEVFARYLGEEGA